jgi:hypothetical protein
MLRACPAQIFGGAVFSVKNLTESLAQIIAMPLKAHLSMEKIGELLPGL